MKPSLTRFLLRFLTLFCCLAGLARAAVDPALLAGLAGDDFDAKVAAIEGLGLAGDADAQKVLQALAEDSLAIVDGKVVILGTDQAFDAATGAPLAAYPESPDTVVLNNTLRRALETANAAIALRASPDVAARLAAANTLRDNADAAMLPLFEQVLAKESDAKVKAVLTLAAARVNLASADPAKRLLAVQDLGASTDPSVAPLLSALLEKKGADWAEPDAQVRTAAKASLSAIERRVHFAENVGVLFSGLSLGSILLLAALGLAITYGVMGVINMAHGELLMVGAYATYVVQNLFHQYLPAHQGWYVVAAIPVAFFAAALVGAILERAVIRFLYGRPLETLLATWGISLVLIQAARVIFGPQNVEVANPDWMSGGIELLAGVVLPWNRIVIIGFAAFVLGLIWLLMNRTRLGLFVRAVTQNRPMAGCVGVPTARIDTLAFAIGAGIAGLGGLALSQIANVGPAMGTGYIVDSFMVVVLGGVGQLAGAVWAALGLGLMSKFLEGWAGAVIAKILVLVFIIVFIQKRPQGLFALKGRFVDS